MNHIGIIQGRLSPRPYPKLQEFPWLSWEKEFEYAAEIGYDFIEWIFEYENYKQNPIWTAEGRKKIKRIMAITGVPVESICADYFLVRPFFRREGYTCENNVTILKSLINNAAEIGAKVILLPVLENAEIRKEEEKNVLMKAIMQVIPELKACNIRLGFETELQAEDYLDLVAGIGSNYVGVYYDAGNCAYRGYDMRHDMEILKEHVINIHIKDRVVGGRSVFLGEGDTNFEEGIPYLMNNDFCGSFVLQTYFENDYLEEASKNLIYIKSLME